MVHREGANATSFVLDLKVNRHLNTHVPIESDYNYDNVHTSEALFYSGSVRHWGESNSIVAVSISPRLVGDC